MGLTYQQRVCWGEDGFLLVPGFLEPERLPLLVERVAELAARAEAGDDIDGAIARPEKALARAGSPVDRLSKIFRVHRREPLFREICEDRRLLGMVGDQLGPDVDCFLSQFIFKHPGALGQPWHQDSWYFRLEPAPQVGAWLAVTEATEDNGPLWVVPGSHTEPVHEAVEFDDREDAGDFYVEIQGADTSDEIPVLMQPGDLLVFHSHLRHRSTDNRSDRMRAAMVYHYARHDAEGDKAFNQDWLPVLRGGEPVLAGVASAPSPGNAEEADGSAGR